MGGSSAHLGGRCTELKRTARHGQYGAPLWLLETLNILMQVVLDFWLLMVPTAAVGLARRRIHTRQGDGARR